MARSFYQGGIGFFGMLIVLALVAAVAYYGWKAINSDDAPPTCSAANSACLAKCRKTATEAPAMQACQQDCQRVLEACK